MADIYIQHLRQHGRVTVADQAVQEVVNAFHEGAEPPRVTHLIGLQQTDSGSSQNQN